MSLSAGVPQRLVSAEDPVLLDSLPVLVNFSFASISLPWRGSLLWINLRKGNFRIAMDRDCVSRLDFL